MNDGTEIGCDETNNSQHANAAMLDFRLAEVVHGKVVRDSKRIKANIVTNVTFQVFWVRKEGHGGALFSVERRDGFASFAVVYTNMIEDNVSMIDCTKNKHFA